MPNKILISACLLGQPVRYNGKGLSLESDILKVWEASGMLVPLCPEVAAGFPTPRPPAEIEIGKTGIDVEQGQAKIFEDTGLDVTDIFVQGAQIAVKTARDQGCKFALLTDGSPSCGSSFIYSGNHDGQKRDGIGIVTAVLQKAGVEVFAQHEIRKLAARLKA